MASLTDLYAQLGLNPLMGTPRQPPMPLMGAQPYTPYDSTVPPTAAMGTPYLGAPTAPAETAPVTEAAPVAAQTYGYSPQPRPALPRPLTNGPGSSMFGDYRDVYSPPAAETDPLTALLGGPSAAPPQPNRLLSSQSARPPAYGAGAGQQQIERQAAQYAGPTPGERALLRRSPVYARAITRIRALDQMRAAKGL